MNKEDPVGIAPLAIPASAAPIALSKIVLVTASVEIVGPVQVARFGSIDMAALLLPST